MSPTLRRSPRAASTATAIRISRCWTAPTVPCRCCCPAGREHLHDGARLAGIGRRVGNRVWPVGRDRHLGSGSDAGVAVGFDDGQVSVLLGDGAGGLRLAPGSPVQAMTDQAAAVAPLSYSQTGPDGIAVSGYFQGGCPSRVSLRPTRSPC